MGTGEFNAEGNPAMDSHMQGGVEILLVASCYRTQDELRLHGQHGMMLCGIEYLQLSSFTYLLRMSL